MDLISLARLLRRRVCVLVTSVERRFTVRTVVRRSLTGWRTFLASVESNL